MGDVLETSVNYYTLKAKTKSEDSGFGKKRAEPMQEPFLRLLAAARSFLDEGQLLLREARQRQEEAIVAVISEQDAEMKGRAKDMFGIIEEVGAVLLPLIRESKPLPKETLTTLNAGLRSIESHYGACSKSDVLPDPLLKAEPGSRMYPSLVKKVEAVCGRSFGELESREIERCRAHILQGGSHKAFDAQRAEFAAALSSRKRVLFEKYAQELSQSDHIQVHQQVPLGRDGSISMVTWNVLEFPGLRAQDLVFDGVRPVCDMLAKYLGRKDAESTSLLLEAVSSDAVIYCHIERVKAFVHDSMTEHGIDIVLLQEIGAGVKECISDMCKRSGWKVHFSTKNDDAKKCDAMTAIVTKRAFDAVTEIEVQRNNKIRHFAAARFSSTWVVSCHLPLTTVPKEKEDLSASFGSYSMKVLQQIWRRFGHSQSAGDKLEVVIGGDWNAPIRNTIKIAIAHPPEACESISLYAPQCETTLNDFLLDEPVSPIDGFFVLR
mmetsp:Transcript_33351/g.84948  ORF Transcript_33351/g.84948 Transcript_33351/m.84948 type:complete len:492 (+) Transcript_33351:62-1537(+)|eukprot:CAMPEP_0183404236 /NCGR_PEP_ID=MMETSP0370-20130417/15048_1 /TAXON_ID=268820 /ORGANISM="Peridinium aciculiferum, Strain PAER-2" /LENGTH=491 /DNA_ID=CAMNT_0025586065 /DNA_START=15 /DNA_END=1490 /DNA_ORIENTATION=-